MNLIVGGLSISGEDKDAVKKNVLSILMKEYGMSEEDFLSAELEVVPALKARDVGFDRAFVAGYGHDDRVCAYPEITATLDTATDRTVMTILADKEEIGSEGTSGMQCVIITDILDEIAKTSAYCRRYFAKTRFAFLRTLLQATIPTSRPALKTITQVS